MVAFTVNGKAQNVSAGDDTPLLWALREHLKMTGTKFGCGAGLCGACTVHVDGEAVFSCQTALSDVAGKRSPRLKVLRRMVTMRFRKPGSPSRCRNAVTASPARS